MMREFTTPPPLSPGDTVAILATSGAHAEMFPHVFELGLERLRNEFELEPVVYPSVEWDQQTLEDNPEDRATELEKAFGDPEIKGIIPVIGGHDQIRVLPHLDAEILRSNPTRFYGYSDNTSLASYLWNLGITTFQGPMVMTELAMQGELFEYTVDYANRAFFEDAIGEITEPDVFTDHDLDWADPDNLDNRREMEPHPGFTFSGGSDTVTGRVYGGNLTGIVEHAIANRHIPTTEDLEGCILALETAEIVPPIWYVTFMLQSLGERGLLEAIDGLLVGRAKARSHRSPKEADERETYRQEQREAIEEKMARYNPDAPIVFDLPFGHTNPTAPLPIGGTVTIDPVEEQITAH